jgi:hypothetical protein
MLARLLGSVNKERVLVFLAARQRGYAREIARFYSAPFTPVLKAIESLEAAGVIVGRDIGNVREYEFSPRYPARQELAALLSKALSLYPAKLREDLLLIRARPRRKGKPLQ